MRTLLFLTIALFFGALSAQVKDANFFKKHPPHVPPAIFADSGPCFVGVAKFYGKTLKVSKKTHALVDKIIKKAHQRVPQIKKEVRSLELAMMAANRNKDYKKFESLLRQLSKVKLDASLFHQSLVLEARRTFDAADVKKIDRFIKDNSDYFLAPYKL